MCLSTATVICLSLGFAYGNSRDWSMRLSFVYLSICRVPYAFEVLHLLYEDGVGVGGRMDPFASFIVSVQFLSFSLFHVNLKIHLTLHREQTEKCFFSEGKKTKSFDADFFPLKEP